MRKIALSAIVALCLPVFAQAGSVTEFVEITSGVFDNAGDGNKTYAIRVTTDTDWTNSDIQINLSSGAMVHFLNVPPFGPATEQAAPQNPFIGDTAVWSPIPPSGNFGVDFPSGTSIANPTYDSANENATFWDVSWFNTATTDIGIFDIGMITLTPDANGTISYRTVTGSEVEDGGYGPAEDAYFIQDGMIVGIPEPGTLALAGLALIGVVTSRRRS